MSVELALVRLLAGQLLQS